MFLQKTSTKYRPTQLTVVNVYALSEAVGRKKLLHQKKLVKTLPVSFSHLFPFHLSFGTLA